MFDIIAFFVAISDNILFQFNSAFALNRNKDFSLHKLPGRG